MKKQFFILFVSMIIVISVHLFGEQTPKYKDFVLGQSKASINEILSTKYKRYSSRFINQTNTIEVQFNEQDLKILRLSFNKNNRLYHIHVSMGKKSNSIFNSKLLDYLEKKYGVSTLLSDKTGQTIWKFQWNLENGRYSITAILYKSKELIVKYDETKISKRMKSKNDNIIFAKFRNVYRKPGKMSYLNFYLGESYENIRSIIQKKYPAAKEVDAGNECRCQNKNTLKYRLKSETDNGSLAQLSEIVFCFDSSRKLCEIGMKYYDKPASYIVDVVQFLTNIYGSPSYLSDNHQTAQWEFESKRYLLAISYTDCVNISILDIEAITSCNNDKDSKNFDDF